MLYRRLVIFFLKCAAYKSTYLLTYLLTYLTFKFRSMFYLAGLLQRFDGPFRLWGTF